MKNFREFVTEAPKKDKGVYSTYKTNLKNTITNLNTLIDYGRKIEIDNKALNPLLDALKNIHTGDDAIRGAYEISIAPPEELENEKEKQKQW